MLSVIVFIVSELTLKIMWQDLLQLHVYGLVGLKLDLNRRKIFSSNFSLNRRSRQQVESETDTFWTKIMHNVKEKHQVYFLLLSCFGL